MLLFRSLWYSFKWGRKCFNGEWTDYAAKLAEGDEISVELDLNAGTLSFYKNGKGLGVAFRNIPSGPHYRLAFWSHYKYSKIRRLSYEDLTTKEQRKRIQKQERMASEHGQMKVLLRGRFEREMVEIPRGVLWSDIIGGSLTISTSLSLSPFVSVSPFCLLHFH